MQMTDSDRPFAERLALALASSKATPLRSEWPLAHVMDIGIGADHTVMVACSPEDLEALEAWLAMEVANGNRS